MEGEQAVVHVPTLQELEAALPQAEKEVEAAKRALDDAITTGTQSVKNAIAAVDKARKGAQERAAAAQETLSDAMARRAALRRACGLRIDGEPVKPRAKRGTQGAAPAAPTSAPESSEGGASDAS